MSVSLEQLEAMIEQDEAPVQQAAVTPQPQATANIELLEALVQQDDSNYPGSGIIEPSLTIGTGMVGTMAGGLAGGVQALNPFAEEGAALEALEATQDAFTVQPKTKEGKANLKSIGDFIESGMKGFNENAGIFAGAVDILSGGDTESAGETKEGIEDRGISGSLGNIVFEETDSAGLATLAGTSPDILMTALGLSSLRAVRTGTRLIDDAGLPTKSLESALDKSGLVFENLTDEAKAMIPDFASPKLLPSPKAETLSNAEEAVKAQIKSGGRDDALATLRLEKDQIKPDNLGKEAIKQGFKPGFVQAVKSANRATKIAMSKMLKTMKRIKSNSRLGLDIRPTDAVGDAVVKRIGFLREKADKARLELNRIAEHELKGAPVDTLPVEARFRDTLEKLDITLVDGPNGVPRPVYEGSLISKDRTSQKVINDAIDLLSEGGRPDALRFHKLKRQLDTMIDFRKKSKDGLTEAGRNVLKDLRSSLNDALRQSNKGYAEVNDTMSQSLGAFENLQKAVGPSIDIFGDASSASLGQDMRGLMSNRKTRVKLDSAINQLDDTARNLGGTFGEDIKDLSLFAHNLDNRFGPVAESGFKAEVASGVAMGTAEKAATQGATVAMVDTIVGGVKKGAEKMKGINDFNAFKSIEALLKRP